MTLVVLMLGCSSGDPSSNNSNNGFNNPNNGNHNNGENNNSNNGNNTVDMGRDLNVPDGKRYRIGTFNVRQFFDTVCDSTCNEASFEILRSDAEFGFRADQIAAGMEEMDLDAVMLQEVESQESLDGLASRTDFGVHELGELGYAGSLDVAVFAKGTLIEVVSHKDDELTRPNGTTVKFSRDFLEVHVDQDGQRLILFSAHFKSKRNDDPTRRLAEAQGAQKIMEEVASQYPDALIVLGGDLNDDPGSDPLEALTAGDLRIVSEAGLWTYSYNGSEDHIDHLVYPVSGNAVYVPLSGQAVRDGSGGHAGSDHSALVAEFVVPD